MIPFLPPPDFLDGVEVFGRPQDGLFDGKHVNWDKSHNFRWNLLSQASNRCRAGDFAEFGVRKGKSAAWLLEFLPQESLLFLLDSWEGLPEAFVKSATKQKPAGHFKCNVPHFTDTRVRIIQGKFAHTWSDLQDQTTNLGLVHLDADLYSSTVEALFAVTPMVGPGTVMVFDELWGYPYWNQTEYPAFVEGAIQEEVTYKWIGRTHSGQASLILT